MSSEALIPVETPHITANRKPHEVIKNPTAQEDCRKTPRSVSRTVKTEKVSGSERFEMMRAESLLLKDSRSNGGRRV
jgi:hypothetical protein